MAYPRVDIKIHLDLNKCIFSYPFEGVSKVGHGPCVMWKHSIQRDRRVHSPAISLGFLTTSRPQFTETMSTRR